jgi:hypothetical protein
MSFSVVLHTLAIVFLFVGWVVRFHFGTHICGHALTLYRDELYTCRVVLFHFDSLLLLTSVCPPPRPASPRPAPPAEVLHAIRSRPLDSPKWTPLARAERTAALRCVRVCGSQRRDGLGTIISATEKNRIFGQW